VKTGDIPAAMAKASAYAACSVTARGTQRSYPDTAEFQRFLDLQ
jgi:ribokinase